MANGSANTHAVMKSSLAKALIESGVQHYDLGGIVGGILNPVASVIKGVGGALTEQNPYQAVLAPTTQSNYAPTVQQAQTNALAVNPQQQALAQQLLAQTQGQGPNPAQAALAQATGQNIAGQGALMAGQRGASGNVGLMARQIAQQGAATQQQAAGQGATLQAQQQLAAENNLGTLLNQQQTGANQLLADAGTLQNQQNTNQVQNYGMQQGINSGVSNANTQSANTSTGGLINGAAGGAAAFLAAAEGGKVEDDGNIMSPTGKAPLLMTGGGGVPGKAPHPGNDLRNDTELSLLSKGEVVLPNSVTQSADPSKKAAEFMKHLKGDKKEDASYDKVANARKALKDLDGHLKKLCMGGKA